MSDHYTDGRHWDDQVQGWALDDDPYEDALLSREDLKARIAELKAENERLRRVIGAAVEDSANLDAERDRAHDDAGNLEGEVNGLKAERDALRDELCSVIRQWSDDYLDLCGYPADVTELSALAQAVWAAASTTA